MGTTKPKAEETAKPEPKQEPIRDILSPCHGATITAYGYATGSGTEAVIDGFCCNHEGCGNEWNNDGSILHWIEGA